MVSARYERDSALGQVQALECKVNELLSAGKKRMEAQKALEKDNKELKKQVEDLKKHASAAEQAVNVEKYRLQTLETERDRLVIENGVLLKEGKKLSGENKGLILKLDESGVELVNALELGYRKCLSRLEGAGVDVVGHSFDDFCVLISPRGILLLVREVAESEASKAGMPRELVIILLDFV